MPSGQRRSFQIDGVPFTADLQPGGAGENTVLLTVAGELDHLTGEALDDAVAAAVALGATQLTLDLEGVTFCDGHGVGCLVRARQRAQSAGQRVRVRRPSPFVVRVVTLADARFVLD